MRHVTARRRAAIALAVGAILSLVAGCAAESPELRASRELADSVQIAGYRRIYSKTAADTVQVYFLGPANVDLAQAVSARGWSPEPPPSKVPTNLEWRWVLAGHADDAEHICNVGVSTLRPDLAPAAADISEDEKQQVAAGQLLYVEVNCGCVGRPTS
jgi:hypothetical protein